MAKIDHPYVCDECSTQKKPSNGWFLLYVNPATHGVTTDPWDDEKAEANGVKHLCGISCVLKVAGRELAKVYNTTEAENGGNS